MKRTKFLTAEVAPGETINFVQAVIDQSQIVEKDAAGKQVNRIPAEPNNTYEFQVDFMQGAWTIITAEILA